MRKDFASRFRKLKKGVQDLAELQLMRAVQACQAAEKDYLTTVEQRRSAEQTRNQCQSVGEFHMWQRYVEALRVKEIQSHQRLLAARQAVAAQRESVQDAYRDVRRWEMVEANAKRRWRQDNQRADMKAADERAVLQFGRVRSR
jgi:flagellar export protein FliJ